jgi:hypothetical protein
MSSMYLVLEGSSASPEVTDVSSSLSEGSESCLGSSGQEMISAAPR